MTDKPTTQKHPGRPITQKGEDGRAHETTEMERRAKDAEKDDQRPVPDLPTRQTPPD
jgi:hypothetical protein